MTLEELVIYQSKKIAILEEELNEAKDDLETWQKMYFNIRREDKDE